MSDKPDSLIGRSIAAKYLIEEKIGQGGMGTVYRARHLVTGKMLAVKVLLEDLAAYDSFVQRFLHEARAAAHLTNPHIINIVDCGRDGDVVYLLMEYLQGTTLHELIQTEGPFTPGRAARILGQICSALSDAHQHSIIHRDLKPDNIILRQVEGERDYVKVLDFGIAKVLDEQGKVNAPASRRVFIGTPEYASPEQCNSKAPTHLSDIYGLGVILFEMLSGRPPFRGEPMDVMMQHASQPPPTLRGSGIEAGAEVEAVVSRALSKNPADRYSTALQLAAEFQAAANRQRRLSQEIPAAKSASPAGQLIEKGSAQRTGERSPRSSGRSPVPSTTIPLTGRLRHMLLVFRSIFVLAGLVSAGYVGYQMYAWYSSMPALPQPPGPPRPPATESAADPLAAIRGLIDQGNRDGATQQLRSLLATSGGADPAGHTLLGVVLHDQGDLEGAADQFRQALDKSGGRFSDAHYHFGLLKKDSGDQTGAMEEFRLANHDTIHPRARLEWAKQHRERGDLAESDRLLKPVEELVADDPEKMLLVGQALALKRSYEAATREIRHAIDLRGESFPEGHYQLGRVLLESGIVPDAVAFLRRAVDQRGGNFPAARCALGRALYQQGDSTAALAELRGAVRLRGGHYPEAELALAAVLSDPSVGAFEEADRVLESAVLQRGGNFPEALEARGRLAFFRNGRLEEARRAWQAAGTEDARELLKSTADAFILQSTGEEVSSTIGDTAPPENSSLSFEAVVWPASAGQPSLRLVIDENGVLFHWVRPPGGPAQGSLAKISPEERRPLDLGDHADLVARGGPLRITIRPDPAGWTIWLNDREIARHQVRAGQPLRVTLRDARAVLYHFQNSLGLRRPPSD